MEIETNRTHKNYQNGKIYSIRSHQTELIYIGSTTEPLSKRLSVHKRDYKRYKNNKHHYITSFEIIKHNDYYIELIENYPCNSKDELRMREGQIIRETANAVNKRIEGRTMSEYQKQYRENNKEQIKEKQKQYYEDNKELFIEYKKQHFNCECGGKYYICDKSKHLKTTKHKQYETNKLL